MKKMLLMSGSKYQQTDYLVHCLPWLQSFLSAYKGKRLAFVPYAGVRQGYDQYEEKVQKALASLEMEIIAVHRDADPRKIIESADAIGIGGGNTYCLLKEMYANDLLEVIRQKVQTGTPYFGWSAGANVAGASIMTTNDMPITYPPSFAALNLFPHQINPHFISGKIQGHNGESREERLEEFLRVNPNAQVYALPEGTALKVEGEQATVLGESDILLFKSFTEPTALAAGSQFAL